MKRNKYINAAAALVVAAGLLCSGCSAGGSTVAAAPVEPAATAPQSVAAPDFDTPAIPADEESSDQPTVEVAAPDSGTTGTVSTDDSGLKPVQFQDQPGYYADACNSSGGTVTGAIWQAGSGSQPSTDVTLEVEGNTVTAEAAEGTYLQVIGVALGEKDAELVDLDQQEFEITAAHGGTWKFTSRNGGKLQRVDLVACLSGA